MSESLGYETRLALHRTPRQDLAAYLDTIVEWLLSQSGYFRFGHKAADQHFSAECLMVRIHYRVASVYLHIKHEVPIPKNRNHGPDAST